MRKIKPAWKKSPQSWSPQATFDFSNLIQSNSEIRAPPGQRNAAVENCPHSWCQLHTKVENKATAEMDFYNGGQALAGAKIHQRQTRFAAAPVAAVCKHPEPMLIKINPASL
jgi:hypothetical protein